MFLSLRETSDVIGNNAYLKVMVGNSSTPKDYDYYKSSSWCNKAALGSTNSTWI
jgi:hypothetical protein